MNFAALLLFITGVGAGPVSFTGSASVYSEYGWVAGDRLV